MHAPTCTPWLVLLSLKSTYRALAALCYMQQTLLASKTAYGTAWVWGSLSPHSLGRPCAYSQRSFCSKAPGTTAYCFCVSIGQRVGNPLLSVARYPSSGKKFAAQTLPSGYIMLTPLGLVPFDHLHRTDTHTINLSSHKVITFSLLATCKSPSLPKTPYYARLSFEAYVQRHPNIVYLR